MDRDEFRKYGYEIVDWIADYFDNVRDYPVKSRVNPGDIKKRLPKQPPVEGEEMNAILKDFQDIIIPGITHWQHPGWFAYFPANNSPASVLGEMLTAGLGVQCMVWETSPAAAELEEVVVGWLRQMLGLQEKLSGVIQDSASSSTLSALLTAREVATGFSGNEKGVSKELRVYASAEAHSSIEKGVKIAGYGRRNLRYIPTDQNYAMIAAELEKSIKSDIESGLKPACVVATIGTTSSTAIDPLPEIGKICRDYGVWLHVDAAFTGNAAILDDQKDLLAGCEYIDSLVFNPHKWMFTNFDCSVYFVKEPDLLIKTLTVAPEYLKTSRDSQVNNYRDWGIQLGRRFRALKLWFVIRQYGVRGLKEIMSNHISMAQEFAGWVKNSDMFELTAPATTNLVCFRWNNGQKSDDDLNHFNIQLLDRVNQGGKAFLSHTVLSGRYTIRMAVGQRSTQIEDVESAWEQIVAAAEELQT